MAYNPLKDDFLAPALPGANSLENRLRACFLRSIQETPPPPKAEAEFAEYRLRKPGNTWSAWYLMAGVKGLSTVSGFRERATRLGYEIEFR